MERRLILMRHAKSAWGTDASSDHERPLNGRGREDAPRVAEQLIESEWEPDAVWSSDAQRTRETWDLMSECFAEPPEAHFTRELYLADLDAICDLAVEWGADLHTILVLGHNPGWEQAVAALAGEAASMTTANAALLVGHGDTWAEALDGDWHLEAIVKPRDLD